MACCDAAARVRSAPLHTSLSSTGTGCCPAAPLALLSAPLQDFGNHEAANERVVGELKALAGRYSAAVAEEQDVPPEKRAVANVGKMDAKKHLAANVTALMSSNINQCMGTMLDTVVF